MQTIADHTTLEVLRCLSKFSNRCMLCGSDVFDDGIGICPACLSKFHFNNGKICVRCGAPLKGEESFCGHCSSENTYFEHAYSAFEYVQGIKNVLHSIKYGNKAIKCYQLAHYLSFLAKRYNIVYDLVCCVPMSDSSKKIRGYNQAELLAKYFCLLNQTLCFSNVLVKIKDTEQQEKLTRQQRLNNVVGVYGITSKDLVAGKRILLIDDVKTTGATLNNCSKALIKAGAKAVTCLTVASGEYKLNVEVDSDV